MVAAGDVVAEDFVEVAEAFLVEVEVIHVAATVEVATRAAAMEVVAIHEGGATAGVVTAVPARCSEAAVAEPAISPADLAEAIFLHPIFLEATSPPDPPLERDRAVGGSHPVERSDHPPEPGPLAEQLSCLPAIAPRAAKGLVPPNNRRAVAQSPRAAKQVRERPANHPSFLPKAQETFLVQRLVPAPARL